MADGSVYLISPPHIVLADFVPRLNEALSTGAISAFQLRLKDTDDEHIRQAIRTLLPLCHTYNLPFILNDRVDLAAEFGADGVHLGQEDMGVKEARTIIGGDAVIGVSCHASYHLAMEAAEAGADYVAFGAFYPTTSKPAEKLEKWGTPSLEILERWSMDTTIPCVAIGGITHHNCVPLIKSGADFIAVISAIWNHPQGAVAAIKEFKVAIG